MWKIYWLSETAAKLRQEKLLRVGFEVLQNQFPMEVLRWFFAVRSSLRDGHTHSAPSHLADALHIEHSTNTTCSWLFCAPGLPARVSQAYMGAASPCKQKERQSLTVSTRSQALGSPKQRDLW